MTPRESLLQSIRDGLATNTITQTDLAGLLTAQPEVTSPHSVQVAQNVPISAPEPESASKKLNAIDILFYLAGLILYAALMVMAFQAGSGLPMIRIIITLGAGLLIWVVTYILGRQPNQTDVRVGLVNSLMITGCLAVASGGFIAAFQATGSSSGSGLAYAVSIAMVLLGSFHLLFDRIFRHIILIVLGMLLLCAAFPTMLIALLGNMTVPPDVWALIGITTGFLVAYGGLIASKTIVSRGYLKDSFESVAAFIILGSIYATGLSSSLALLWEIILPVTIYGAFFISIKRRSKNFLITGSLFLVLFLITASFKYFSGLGVSFCLILSAFSLLATAFMAANINKKYIKQAQAS